MRAGQLKDQITFQRQSAGAWADARTVWARVETEPATVPKRYRISIRYKTGITADQRIVFGSTVLAMIGEPDEVVRRRELLITAQATGESLHDTEEETVTANGAAITFTRITHAHDATTHRLTPTTTTIAGHFEQRDHDLKRFEGLGLRTTQAVSGRFVPTTLGDVLEPGDTGVWNSITYTVRDVDTTAPDGDAVAATIIMTR